MPMRKYRPTLTTSASSSSSNSNNLTITNVTPTITTLAGATNLTHVPHHHRAAAPQRVVHHHHHHAANCNLNLISTATGPTYQTPQPIPIPQQVQQGLRRTISAPPILDPLPLCLDANGTYLCTAYNPRCYIIQKVIFKFTYNVHKKWIGLALWLTNILLSPLNFHCDSAHAYTLLMIAPAAQIVDTYRTCFNYVWNHMVAFPLSRMLKGVNF